ncbi:MAG: sulfatase family protein [Pseudomonadota bacterium]
MRWRWISISAAAVSIAAGLALLVERVVPTGVPTSVIVLTMESARAEILSPATMPIVWRLAEESGIRLERHRAVSGWTAANIVSLLSGVSPFAHGVHTRDVSVPKAWTLPLEDLARAGWRVAGLQSFMQIENFRDLGLTIEPRIDPLAWLEERARERRPFFLWYHYLNTHLPYAPNPPFRPDWERLLPPDDPSARTRIEKVISMSSIPAGEVDFRESDRPAIRALYLANFSEFDAWFAEFWDFLSRSGLRERTIVVLTTDHGEELLERGHVGHASTTRAGHLYEEIVRVPLVIWLPPGLRQSAPPKVVIAPSHHLDVMPTLLSLLGRPPSPVAGGHNLLALPAQRPWSGATSQAGFSEPDPKHLRHFAFARVDGRWKLQLFAEDGAIVRIELYDLDADPGERRNLAGAHPDIAQKLKDALMPQILTLRVSKPGAGEPNLASAREAPRWILPAAGGDVRYDDQAGRFRLQWSGDPEGSYRVQYEAGQGVLRIAGEFEVAGTGRDFGVIDRRYWNTWIVPYGTFRLRVGVGDRDDLWSPWIDLRALPRRRFSRRPAEIAPGARGARRGAVSVGARGNPPSRSRRKGRRRGTRQTRPALLYRPLSPWRAGA